MKRLSIVYQVMARSGVLVGSTADVLGIGIDKTTMRRRRVSGPERQEPLIPGSTLKGKIRNEYERVLASLGHTVCRSPRAETMCPHDPQVANPPCPVCQIFGGSGLQSRLFFSDAVAKANGTMAPYLTRVQAGVALSRKRRTAEDERLYYTERGVEGVVYEGTIDGYLDDGLIKQQVALIMATIERLFAVGGSKSRGSGWINAKITSVIVDGKEMSEAEIRKIREEGLEAWRESK
jgi:CRISPR/Cas system CSM-associated protein Csm3 (group 7 of RAMP superfamily)